jgi:hypothetical protein
MIGGGISNPFSPAVAHTWSADQTFTDDTKLLFGTGGDVVMLNRASALNADTALSTVLIGTPVTPALAANSAIISNVTASGDILIAGNRGGASEAYLFADTSAGVLYLTPTNGGLTIGLEADAPAPDQANSVHIWADTAGSVTADGAARLIIEDNAQAVLQFLVPANTNAGIYVGSPAGAYRGALYYNNTGASPGDTWRFVTAGTERLLYSDGAFAFQQATTISTTASTLTLNPTTEVIVSAAIGMGVVSDPSGVSNHAHVYVKDDPAEVYVRDEDGNVTKISPHNEQGEWEFYSYNSETGKSFRVNMEYMVRKLEEITGEKFIQEEAE